MIRVATLQRTDDCLLGHVNHARVQLLQIHVDNGTGYLLHLGYCCKTSSYRVRFWTEIETCLFSLHPLQSLQLPEPGSILRFLLTCFRYTPSDGLNNIVYNCRCAWSSQISSNYPLRVFNRTHDLFCCTTRTHRYDSLISAGLDETRKTTCGISCDFKVGRPDAERRCFLRTITCSKYY